MGLNKQLFEIQNNQTKMFLKDISELISLTDRQLKPYSHVKHLHFDKSERKLFK